MQNYFTTEEIAINLKISSATVRKYIKNSSLKALKIGRDYRIKRDDLDSFIHSLSKVKHIKTKTFSISSENKKLENFNKPSFIDLFAGIGGTRIGFEKAGGQCIFTSEWDKYSQITYQANFGDLPKGDITQIQAKDIPYFDILVGGFPCQPFSLAGVSKKNSLGRVHGFKDQLQGNLFFDIARILEDKQPMSFLLENVKNLASHDKGKTFEIIKETLDSLGYWFDWRIVDGALQVPQHRERVYIVGFRKDLIPKDFIFNFPEIENKKRKISEILEKKVDDKYTLSDKLWNYLQAYAEKHRLKGNGFGFGLVDLDKQSRTLSARYHKDGAEILIPQVGKNPRRLTPRECARLMGFDDSYKIPVSDSQAYRQFGNSVVVPVIEKIAVEIVKVVKKLKQQKNLYSW